MQQRTRTRYAGTAVVAVALLAAACAKQVSTNPPPPIAPKTALQWTIVYNAALAKANLGVETAVEAVQKSGAITAAQARPVIAICARVALASEAIRGITSKGTEASWSLDGPKIRAVLDQLGPDLLPKAGLSNQTVDLALAALGAVLTLLNQNVGGLL